MTTFIGVDLAWTSYRPSGVCVLRDRGAGPELVALFSRVVTPAEIVRLATADHQTIVAIDAPLLVGRGRTAEKALYREYGKHEAGAYLATEEFLASFNATAGPDAGRALAASGVAVNPSLCSMGCQVAIEVYPHAAHIALFGIDKTLKYKRGRVACRVAALREYQRLLAETAARVIPNAAATHALSNLLTTDPLAERGKRRKALEDKLDAVTCACVAVIAGGGPDAIDVFGDEPLLGHIVVPKRVAR